MFQKKKQILQILLGIAAVIVCAGVLLRSSPRGRLHSLQVSEKEYQDLLDTHSLTDADLLQGLWLNEQKTFFDRSAGTFYSSLIEGDDTRFDPLVTADGNGIRLAVCSEPIDADFVKNNGTVRLLAYNNTDCREYALKLTELPMINLVTAKEITKNFPVTFTMEFFDNRADAPVHFSSSIGTIHLRGASSLMYPKQSYKINLRSSTGKTESRDPGLLGMRENSDWILYSPYAEKDCVRNVFSTKLWTESCADHNSFGIENGYDYRYVEVFLNGSYHGLYAFGYMPDDLQLQAEESSGEVIYKNYDSFDYRTESDHLEEKFRIFNAYEGLSSYAAMDEWKPLKDYIQLLNSHAPIDELWKRTDRGSYVDFCLYMNLIQSYDCAGNDGTVKNFYITAKQRDNGYVMLYTPWDMDLTWGKHFYDYPCDFTENWFFTFGPYGEYPVRENPDLQKELSARYQELRADGWSDAAVDQLIDECEARIFDSGAYARDKERWPESDLVSGQNDLSEFRDYVKKRLAYCDDYYAGN